jgi:hypothetical protein
MHTKKLHSLRLLGAYSLEQPSLHVSDEGLNIRLSRIYSTMYKTPLLSDSYICRVRLQIMVKVLSHATVNIV